MAQFFFDFTNRDDIIDETPPELIAGLGLPLDVARAYIAGEPYDGPGTTALFMDGRATGGEAFEFIGVPTDVGDVELVVAATVSGLAQANFPYLRTSGTSANRNGYSADGRNNGFFGRRWLNESGAGSVIWNVTVANNNVRRIRLQMHDTNLRGRVTNDVSIGTEDSKDTWDGSVTDANHASGRVGWFQRAGASLIYWFGIGTDGDPAPTGPVEVSAEPFLLRHNPRTNKVIPVLSSPTVTDIGANCVRPRVTKGF